MKVTCLWSPCELFLFVHASPAVLGTPEAHLLVWSNRTFPRWNHWKECGNPTLSWHTVSLFPKRWPAAQMPVLEPSEPILWAFLLPPLPRRQTLTHTGYPTLDLDSNITTHGLSPGLLFIMTEEISSQQWGTGDEPDWVNSFLCTSRSMLSIQLLFGPLTWPVCE